MKTNEFKNKYYYIKNFYYLGSNLKVKDKIFLNIEGKYYDLFKERLDHGYYEILPEGIKVNLKLTEKEIDGYSIHITFKNRIDISFNNTRSLLYVINVLNDLAYIEKDEVILPMCLIEDEASFLYRGIVEGFYGEPWSHRNRIDMVNFMSNHRLNAYMYAPKCDRYHRDKWYEPYPQDEIDKFSLLNKLMKREKIDFYYCISPGHAPAGEEKFIYVGDSDFIRLFKKLDQLIEIGITSFGLLLDDIDYNLSGENLRIFKRPGLAHAHICNRVYEYLNSKVDNLKFVMCPTEYHEIGESEYRKDLRENLNKNIYAYWTGDNVCAEVITDEQILLTQKAYGNKIILWENFPVTDFTYGVRQYMGPILNRSVDMHKYIDGFFINPMEYYEISKVSMITECHYAWNTYRYDSEKSFEVALREIDEDFYKFGLDYINYNLPSVLTYGNLDYEKELVRSKNYEGVLIYYDKVWESCKKLLDLDLPIIDELRPWLLRVGKEYEVVRRIINGKIEHQELLTLLDDIHFSGSELFDYLVKQEKLLSDEEYERLITKRRGNPWYRVWEYKRG